jgi:hypothetical protein
MCSGTGSCGEIFPRLKGGLFFELAELGSCDSVISTNSSSTQASLLDTIKRRLGAIDFPEREGMGETAAGRAARNPPARKAGGERDARHAPGAAMEGVGGRGQPTERARAWV